MPKSGKVNDNYHLRQLFWLASQIVIQHNNDIIIVGFVVEGHIIFIVSLTGIASYNNIIIMRPLIAI